MADADVRWLQRLDNYGRALATLQRAIATARSRPLNELEGSHLPSSSVHAYWRRRGCFWFV